MAASSAVRTVDRIAAILECFTPREPYLSMSEISERLGLAKSTAHRLLSSMVENGFLSRAPDRTYSLGYQFIYWASIVQSEFDLGELAHPFLERLNGATGETAILTVLEDRWVVCVEKVESTQAVRLVMPIGKRRYPHAGASAKILMAYMPPEAIAEAISATGLPRLMKNTITDPDELRRELEGVRQRSYATSFEETDEGTMGVAAAVFDRSGSVLAGIGVACPMSRCALEDVPGLARLVTRAARDMSDALGGSSQGKRGEGENGGRMVKQFVGGSDGRE
jgi:IclR family KDG regulon transcriptional repressor